MPWFASEWQNNFDINLYLELKSSFSWLYKTDMHNTNFSIRSLDLKTAIWYMPHVRLSLGQSQHREHRQVWSEYFCCTRGCWFGSHLGCVGFNTTV